MDEKHVTKVHTYKVTMIVEVLSRDDDMALQTLDQNGGYMTDRQVELLNITPLARVDLGDKPEETAPAEEKAPDSGKPTVRVKKLNVDDISGAL